MLLYKRMENGGGFQWPRSCAEMRSLSWQKFRWLIEGLSIDQPRANKSMERCVLVVSIVFRKLVCRLWK